MVVSAYRTHGTLPRMLPSPLHSVLRFHGWLIDFGLRTRVKAMTPDDLSIAPFTNPPDATSRSFPHRKPPAMDVVPPATLYEDPNTPLRQPRKPLRRLLRKLTRRNKKVPRSTIPLTPRNLEFLDPYHSDIHDAFLTVRPRREVPVHEWLQLLP